MHWLATSLEIFGRVACSEEPHHGNFTDMLFVCFDKEVTSEKLFSGLFPRLCFDQSTSKTADMAL